MARAFLPALLVAIAWTSDSFAARPAIAIEWNPNEKPSPVWLGYLISRTVFREKHKLSAPASGEVIPTFAEEVTARSDALQIYQELRATNGTPREAYWEDFSRVAANKFTRAYVWIYFRRASWPHSEKPADLAAFQRWSKLALKNHRGETHGRIVANRE